MRTILQAKTGIQPHPVPLQSSCSDPVCADKTGPQTLKAVGGGEWGQVGASGVPVGSGAPDIWGGECRAEALGGGSKAQGGAFFPLLPWLRGAWAQAEKQGCYVAMETEGSSLPHSRIHGDWGVGAGGGCFPGSTKGWG